MPTPPFRILSNGRLRSIITRGGQGGLFHHWIALTRWRETSPCACGPMVYLRENGRPAENLDLTIDAAIPAETDAEIRKITLTNLSNQAREIVLTTCAEVVLNHPMADLGHPAFSKLFVQTAVAGQPPVLLAHRRPRGNNEAWPWMAQALVAPQPTSWETNRATFIGRGRELADPAALDHDGPLSGQTGNVLDPVFAWRTSVALAPSASTVVWLVTGIANDPQQAADLVQQIGKGPDNAFTTAQADAVALTDRLGISQTDALRYQTLAGQMLTSRSSHPAPPSLDGSAILERFPLSPEELRVVANSPLTHPSTQDILKALPLWQALGLQARIFILDPTNPAPPAEKVTIVDPANFTQPELTWWLATAQLVIDPASAPASLELAPPSAATPLDLTATAATEPLTHFNGHGGFSASGREYVIPLNLHAGRLQLPPMPWCNVLANPHFGCLVSEAGATTTWARNSQANRLTPWANDPVTDPHTEAVYLLDEEDCQLWSPLPGPCAPRSAYVVRHGFGRTTFTSEVAGIAQRVEILVTPHAPLKLISIQLENRGTQERQLSIASFQQLVLGSTPDRHHAILAWAEADTIQFARNPRPGDFSDHFAFAFAAVHGTTPLATSTCHSRAQFLGTTGTSSPAALADPRAWTSTTGLGRDACFARKITISLPAGSAVEIVLGLGEAATQADARALAHRFQQPDAIRHAGVDDFWNNILGAVSIRTPLAEIDPLINGWLLYQNLACRIWGRTAFYQSGGAFGFRDQLQDSGAFAALQPQLMREQILLHAAQQFEAGDVTHWWHPEPIGRGMRTNFSDDLLWLPYLTEQYLHATADLAILDELRPFLVAPPLAPGEDEHYLKPEISTHQASVFEHCCLAIDKSLALGTHGLPLMGIGDWNDGMSRVGREGRGESVWMGFFLIAILERWIPLCQQRGATQRATIYQNHRDQLLAAVNTSGWDGSWYRRAYYDDGTPLGTHTDTECRIDALAQAWAILSKAAPPERANQALDALEDHLVDSEAGLIRLLHPPFVNTPKDPGYIKGYVAGVRENGGQYTHAACWVVRAMAEAGRRQAAADLLRRLSPLWHTRNPEAVSRYKVEPYVVAADIYGAEPHVGRGGWTWYTGSAGWLFRVTLESILGLRVEEGRTLVLQPKVPDSWPGFEITYRAPDGSTTYHITVTIHSSAKAITSATLDGLPIHTTHDSLRWPIANDARSHTLAVHMGQQQ